MKRGTPRHRKMHALAAALKLPLHSAVGIMEMLWHYTAQNTPEGDIGSVPDREIASAVDWPSPRKAEVLVSALVETGWLDRNETYRLIVHDWPEHCEQAVRKWLDRNRKKFLPVYGQMTDAVRTNDGQMTDSVRPSREAEARAVASDVVCSSEKTTTPEVSTSALAVATSGVGEVFDELKSIYRQAGKPIPEKHENIAVQMLLGIPQDRLPRVPNYVKWALVSGTWSDAAHTKSLLNLLRDGDWDVEITQRTLPTPDKRPHRLTAEEIAAL